MKKVLNFFSLLPLLSASVQAESNLCTYSLKVNDSRSYSVQEYTDFIKNEFRPKLSKDEGQFKAIILKSCSNAEDKRVAINIDSQNFIFLEINQNKIDKENKRYASSDVVLNKEQFYKAFETASNENFSNQDKKIDKEDALKFFGFIFSDAARYDDILSVSNNMLNKNCTYQREKYIGFIRSWTKQSSFISWNDIKIQNAYLGGVNCRFGVRYCLISPITHEAAIAFMQSKNNEDSISLPKDECQ